MAKWPVYLVELPPEKLAKTFLRFQEYYESSKFRKAVFQSDYFSDWDGFNIPSGILAPFKRGDFDPLSREEKALLRAFRGVTGKFYVIGISNEGDNNDLRHEIVHALLFLDKKYDERVFKCFRDPENNDARSDVFSVLERKDYHRSVFYDEANAYLTADISALEPELAASGQVQRLSRQLRVIFRDCFKFEIHRASREKLLNMVHRIKIPGI